MEFFNYLSLVMSVFWSWMLYTYIMYLEKTGKQYLSCHKCFLKNPSNWTLLQDFKRQVCREISRVAPLKDAELKELKKAAAVEMTSGVWSCLLIAELVVVDECVDIMKQPQVT